MAAGQASVKTVRARMALMRANGARRLRVGDVEIDLDPAPATDTGEVVLGEQEEDRGDPRFLLERIHAANAPKPRGS